MSQVGSISNANPNTTNITNDNKIKKVPRRGVWNLNHVIVL